MSWKGELQQKAMQSGTLLSPPGPQWMWIPRTCTSWTQGGIATTLCMMAYIGQTLQPTTAWILPGLHRAPHSTTDGRDQGKALAPHPAQSYTKPHSCSPAWGPGLKRQPTSRCNGKILTSFVMQYCNYNISECVMVQGWGHRGRLRISEGGQAHTVPHPPAGPPGAGQGPEEAEAGPCSGAEGSSATRIQTGPALACLHSPVRALQAGGGAIVFTGDHTHLLSVMQ